MTTPNAPRRAARVTLCLAAAVAALVVGVPAVAAQSDSYTRDTLPPATTTTRPGDVRPSTTVAGPTTTAVSPDTTATTITGRRGGVETTLPAGPTSTTPGEETRRPATLERAAPSGALPVTGGDVLGLVVIGGAAIAAGMGARRLGRRRG